MLRSEQDREYREMMETDRRMQEEKQMVSEFVLKSHNNNPHYYCYVWCGVVCIQERERIQKEEEEALQQKELEAALALSVQLAKEDRVSAAKKKLNERGPPPADSAALIRFQLPNGVKISDKFHRDDKIAVSTVSIDIPWPEPAMSKLSCFVWYFSLNECNFIL